MDIALILFQMIMLPTQVLFWWAAREERKRKDLLLKTALRALGIIAVSRGSRGKN